MGPRSAVLDGFEIKRLGDQLLVIKPAVEGLIPDFFGPRRLAFLECADY